MKTCAGFILFLTFLLISNSCFTQTHEPRFDRIAGTNGISLGKINGITRDKHGIMWMTDQTNKCLQRYDGNHLTRYQNDPKNKNSLGGSYPECVYADSSGIIWIGFYGMGLDRFDPETSIFTHYRHQTSDAGGLSNDTVTAVMIDHLGNIWVGDYGGLDLLDPRTGKFKHFSHRPDDSTSLSWNRVRALYEDHAGTIWVGTGLVWDKDDKGGLNRFHRETGTFTRYLNDPKNPHSLINNKVRAIFEDSRGIFWIGTMGDGLHTMDRKTGNFERFSYNPVNPEQLSRPPLKSFDDHITFITEDADSNIWIGTFSNGLIRYDPVSKKTNHFGRYGDQSSGFKDNSPWWSITSQDGLFWICTQENNLYRVDIYTNNISHYKLDSAGVNSYYQETTDILWLGTQNGLVRKNLKTGKLHIFRNDPKNLKSISSSRIGAVQKDKQGNIWICTQEGLNRFNPPTLDFTRFPHDPKNSESPSTNNMFKIYADHLGDIWIATLGYGLDQMNPQTGNFHHFKNNPDDSNSISENFITAILEDEAGEIWAGAWNNGGLNRLNRKTGKFRHYLVGTSIEALYMDSAGIIWIGTGNGLISFNRNSEKFVYFNQVNTGLNITAVRSIIGDVQNNLWVASVSGIYRINKNRDQAVSYGKENGISTDYLLTGSAFKGLDGKLYFGNYTGYYAFSPEKLKMNPSVPKIVFTNFLLNGLLISPDPKGPMQEAFSKAKEIRLQFSENVFSLGFNTIDFLNAEDKKIFYRLENYDKDWKQPSSDELVYYFNVPPGKYVFHVKAVNSANGIWQEKTIAVLISPPWWRKWWAYCLYALFFLAAAFSFDRVQKQRVVRAERERNRERDLKQAKEMEKAYRELKTTQNQLIQSEKMASLGVLTAGIAHEIQNPLNFINNFSEVNSELIDELEHEAEKGNIHGIKTITKDIKANEQKINHHGKRADAIVKGMLQHSKSGTGKKEPTDINALADEYLRLAYHGLRAKETYFNATIKTDYDISIEKINIIPQDFGRVMLNLYNNAFYAVNEKNKTQANGYEPTVTATTRKLDNRIEIRVRDNGNGIPEKVQEKIFQPFFTTKPTGQGTGLGLSLSYDIIKAHGGEIRVETQVGAFTEFIIRLDSRE